MRFIIDIGSDTGQTDKYQYAVENLGYEHSYIEKKIASLIGDLLHQCISSQIEWNVKVSAPNDEN